METLVVVAHPSIEKSIVNRYWIEELKQYPEMYTIHELYKAYPTENIDGEKERNLIESHQNLVLQFPIQWFNCPPLLKKWLDDVLDYGWAYGSGGDKLKDRKVALAVSAGIQARDYSENGRYGHTLEQILIPFETTFFYCKADYRSIHAFYGEEQKPGGTEEKDLKPFEHELAQNTKEYLTFLKNL